MKYCFYMFFPHQPMVEIALSAIGKMYSCLTTTKILLCPPKSGKGKNELDFV
jgi:hypothetical protein